MAAYQPFRGGVVDRAGVGPCGQPLPMISNKNRFRTPGQQPIHSGDRIIKRNYQRVAANALL